MATECALHCVICFEEFSLRERPPVILPCGHTYVCLVCSKRLKRCMECREPLFWTPPPPSKGPAIMNNTNLNSRNPQLRFPAARRGYGDHQPYTNGPPVQLQEPIPLPLPKNLVLLEMIESAERQARLLNEANGIAMQQTSSDVQSNDNGGSGNATGGDDNDDKLEITLARIVSLTGTCGTYAVRDPEGLAVLPFDPNRQHHDAAPSDEEEEKKVEEMREPFTIEAGSTVQIVAVDEGVYKLPRGVGFIVASANQLVKGTNSLSCSILLELGGFPGLSC